MSDKLQDRKQDLPQFRELFLALFKIKDSEVQKRVLDAINGPQNCAMMGKLVEEKYTQTYREDFEMIQNSDAKSLEVEASEKPSKKRTKRKLRGPRVEKSSGEVKKVLIQNDRTIKIVESKFDDDEKDIKTKIVLNSCNFTKNSTADLDPYLQDVLDYDDTYIEEMVLSSRTESLMSEMKKEYNCCLKYSDQDLLPIHEAILCENLNKFKRQLYILRFLEITLSEVLVQNQDTNLLQFAIMNRSKSIFFEEILKHDPKSILEKDLNENNLIHLALEYLNENSDIHLFKTLLKSFKFDFNNLKYFEETNSNGQTVFHVSVNRNKPIFCHLLFERVDSILGIKSKNFKNEELLKDILLQHYIDEVNNYTINFTQHSASVQVRKRKIVNCRDLKHGLTPLNQAVQNKNELLIRIFLTNFADTGVKSYSGLSSIEQCETDSKIYNIIMEYLKFKGDSLF